MNGVNVLLVICLGCLVVGRNVEYKYEKSEYHHDEPNDDGYIMVDGYPEGEESYYYEDGSTADTHYSYAEEETRDPVEKREEYHIEYQQNHSSEPVEDHHQQYEHHYVQQEREHNGQKLVKSDYNYERKGNQVIVRSEEAPKPIAHAHHEEKQPKPPSKRVHIKLPEFDYSSYSKTDSEIQYEKPMQKPKKDMKRYSKIGKHQYIQKPQSPPTYENIQKIPIEYPRGREVIRHHRVKMRPNRPLYQVPYKETIQTIKEVVIANDGERYSEDARRPSGKTRRVPARTSNEEGKDHVLYYVDQPVQVYDPKEKKFHKFDKLSEKEAEELKKGSKEQQPDDGPEEGKGVEDERND